MGVQMIMVVAFQPDQLAAVRYQAKRPGTDPGLLRMRQTAAVAGKTVRQPEIRTVQFECQTPGMRDFNIRDAGK
jgi:hypothetical protein